MFPSAISRSTDFGHRIPQEKPSIVGDLSFIINHHPTTISGKIAESDKQNTWWIAVSCCTIQYKDLNCSGRNGCSNFGCTCLIQGKPSPTKCYSWWTLLLGNYQYTMTNTQWERPRSPSGLFTALSALVALRQKYKCNNQQTGWGSLYTVQSASIHININPHFRWWLR